ncbi:chloride channel protein, CIC family [Geoalkalibacter ferrihydriticus]|uniref:Chloride channel protein, CIC family n=1 Tax=Geoalkalibacter ferrihydriticus TaxID=392333 RepID=A0A1G9TPU5_9BACT|nr:chloride channel protein [Geoalkalibacter ferrihydriticus]SDM49135.1 chloride channel protein, CIC family [Geoalkalibacter ferrihydriticus]
MKFFLSFPHRIFGSWLRRASNAWQSRFRISENTFMLVMAVVIGLLSGLCNYAFRMTIEFFEWAVLERGFVLLGASPDYWTWGRLLVFVFPVIGGILLIPFGIFFAKDMRYGFARFLEHVNLRGAKIPLRTIFTRGAASAITIGTGGSAGQEGPIAQIGGAVGSQFGQAFRVSGDHLKVLVACGVSGGVAATFNAPIAGVFFAAEIVLLSSFQLSSFTYIVVASGMSTVVSRALLGNIPAFAVPLYSLGSHWELLFYVALGMIVGVLAAGFIEIHGRIKDAFDRLRMHRLAKPVFGGLLVGLLGIGFPQVFGNGYHFMERVLHGDGVWYLLAALVLMKALATSITLGSGLPGGLFAPALYIGAVTGGAFGKLVQMLFPALNISPGAFALVGMGAFLSAATHAPMTAIFLLFEMTASYEVIIPIMLSCVIGTSIARHLKKDSLDTLELSRAGIDLEAGKERNIMKSIKVGEVMVRKPEVLPENMTLGQFAEFIAGTRHTNFPLVDDAGRLTGIISVQDFLGVVFEKDLMDLVVIKELATLDVITVTADANLDEAMRRIGHRNIEQLPVVDGADSRRLVGIISRRDMVSAYNRALMTRSLEEKSEV